MYFIVERQSQCPMYRADVKVLSSYVSSHNFPSMWRTYGHRDCSGWIQQHLSLGSHERVPPETDPCARHRAQKHTGGAAFPQICDTLWLSWPSSLTVFFSHIHLFCTRTGQCHPVCRQFPVWVQTERVPDQRRGDRCSVPNHTDVRPLYQHLPRHPVRQVGLLPLWWTLLHPFTSSVIANMSFVCCAQSVGFPSEQWRPTGRCQGDGGRHRRGVARCGFQRNCHRRMWETRHHPLWHCCKWWLAVCFLRWV